MIKFCLLLGEDFTVGSLVVKVVGFLVSELPGFYISPNDLYSNVNNANIYHFYFTLLICHISYSPALCDYIIHIW